MARTTFRNASGLHHPQQKTTAHDMAVLGRALLRDFPRHYSIFATRTFRYGSARYGNHNRLLGAYRGMDGIKTGYTDQAGFNLVASAERNGRRIIGVVMASPSSATRNARMVALLDEGFRAAPNAYAVKSGVSGRHVARAKSMSRLAAKRSHHGAIAVASRTAWRKAEAKRKTASTHPLHAEATGGWFRVAQASPHSGKSGTLKGNPGQAHAALGLR